MLYPRARRDYGEAPMEPAQVERLLTLIEGIHGLVARVETRLEELKRETDLQRETLDGILVNMMEIVDRTRD